MANNKKELKKWFMVILGALFIAGSVLAVLEICGLTEVSFNFDGWWTLFIIIPSLVSVITGENRLGGIFGVALGVLLLLAARGIFDYSYIVQFIIPLIVFIVGIKIITKSLSSDKKQDSEVVVVDNIEDDEEAEGTAESEETKTISKIAAVFGGSDYNLSTAKIVDGSKLELVCVFGGADIILPENINVKIKTLCLFGGISDERVVKQFDENAPTLTIEGFCVFGGAEIH